MFAASMTWVDLNPDFEYRFYDDVDCTSLIADRFGKRALSAFRLIDGGAYKAGFWRLCVLYLYGGVYADIDSLCRRPLSKLIRPEDEFIAPKGEAPCAINDAFICSVPRHPFLGRSIARAIERIESRRRQNLFAVVGPIGLGISTNIELGRVEEHPIQCGSYHHQGRPFRILEKVLSNDPHERGVLDGPEVVLHPKYLGYKEDLASMSVTHWKDGVRKRVRRGMLRTLLARARRLCRAVLSQVIRWLGRRERDKPSEQSTTC